MLEGERNRNYARYHRTDTSARLGTRNGSRSGTWTGKSTVHNHLQTLRRRGYVIQDGDEYRLSLRFLHLGQGVRTSRTAYQLVKEKVEWLADETGERSQFIVEEQGCGVYMFCELGTDGVQTDSGSASASRSTRPPRARPSSALPDSRVDEIIEGHKLERFTDRTLTEPTELRREIAQIRERGYADNRGETTTSLWAVGVPVRDADGTLLGAMSASAPSQRMKGERAQSMLPDLLLAVANELELNIRYV